MRTILEAPPPNARLFSLICSNSSAILMIFLVIIFNVSRGLALLLRPALIETDAGSRIIIGGGELTARP